MLDHHLYNYSVKSNVAGVNSASHAFGPSFANKKSSPIINIRLDYNSCYAQALLRKDSVLEAEGGKGELIIYKNGKLMLTNKALEKLIIRLGIWED
ncbi:hypothetical protein LguiB_009369 [Lonicera macranthoides]